jgi:hypothetical protein
MASITGSGGAFLRANDTGLRISSSRMSVFNSVKARLRPGVEQGDRIVFAFFGREDEISGAESDDQPPS